MNISQISAGKAEHHRVEQLCLFVAVFRVPCTHEPFDSTGRRCPWTWWARMEHEYFYKWEKRIPTPKWRGKQPLWKDKTTFSYWNNVLETGKHASSAEINTFKKLLFFTEGGELNNLESVNKKTKQYILNYQILSWLTLICMLATEITGKRGTLEKELQRKSLPCDFPTRCKNKSAKSTSSEDGDCSFTLSSGCYHTLAAKPPERCPGWSRTPCSTQTPLTAAWACKPKKSKSKMCKN